MREEGTLAQFASNYRDGFDETAVSRLAVVFGGQLGQGSAGAGIVEVLLAGQVEHFAEDLLSDIAEELVGSRRAAKRLECFLRAGAEIFVVATGVGELLIVASFVGSSVESHEHVTHAGAQPRTGLVDTIDVFEV